MDKIQVAVLEEPQNLKMPAFLARMTQRGHLLHDMSDVLDLYNAPVKNEKLLQTLSEMSHGTIKRFNTYTVVVLNASRRFLAQARTHQHTDFVSGSLQYSDWSNTDNPEEMFVVPYAILDNPSMREYYLNACLRNYLCYQTLTEQADNDTAGFILPNAMRNILVFHANIQQWQYMIKLRTCRRNSDETRYIFLRIWEELQKTTNGTEVFSIKSTGPVCQSSPCEEGHMSCRNVLDSAWGPSEILNADFPLLRS